MFTLAQNIAFFLIGGIAGISMGSIGIGAGLLTMPLLIYTGMTLKEAVAAAMVMQLLPQSAPGVYNYWNHIRWMPSFLVVVGSTIGIWIGSHCVTDGYLSNRTLYRIITVFLFVSAIYFSVYHWNHND